MDISLTHVAGPYLAETAETQLTRLPWEPVDSGELHTFPVTSRGVLFMVQNTGSGSNVPTLTIYGSPDEFGRVANISAVEVPAGETDVRVFVRHGWETHLGSGQVAFESSSNDIEVVVIAL